MTAVILFSGALCAQTRNVVLTWTASVTPTVTYNVYRAPAPCAPLPTTFAKRNATPVTATTFTDSAVATGTYCYYVTAAASSGLESIPSNTTGAAIEAPPQPPTNANAQVVVVVNVTVNGAQAQPAQGKKAPAKR